MNKLQTLILMLLPIMAMLTGCEDKNEPEDKSSQLIGTWYISETTSGDYVSVRIEQSYTFRTNKTATAKMQGYMNNTLMTEKIFEYTYSFNGKILSLKNVDSGKTSTYTATISGRTLTIKGNDGEMVYHKR